MQALSLNEIRHQFLEFFRSKDHLILPSASLVPRNDPSVLLINAGMTPFKPYFTGAAVPPSKRVATCQKCIRTPDIERVGRTARHGTYFEMLGNFSFGDYFKEEAIAWAWEFCVDVLKMPEALLSVSIYLDDDEAYDIWHDQIGLPAEKIFRFGKEDNFWEHGIGPCGPCSEIFFDRGEKYGCGKDTCTTGCDCDRFVEFWNLVFTQYYREEDGSYSPLENKNIDTGGGLERFAVIMQDVDNLFEVDTIRAILDQVVELAGTAYGEDEEKDVAIRVITDHIRSAVMMLSDGILPGNEGRGYVLRRLIRRAARYGRKLGIESGFLTGLAPTVIQLSGEAYPNLVERQDRILLLLSKEEARFDATVTQGLAILEDEMAAGRRRGSRVLDGQRAFLLHDTYGFPLDLTREIAAESGFELDLAGFDAAMARQKEQAREALKSKVGSAWENERLPDTIERDRPTVFTGYDTLTDQSLVTALVKKNSREELEDVDLLSVGDQGYLLVEHTPFYAAAGGQIGDQGELSAEDGLRIRVFDASRTEEGLVLHHIEVLAGEVAVGQTLELRVNRRLRLATARNHTTTHLLHRALKNVLGDHVEQAGSEVSPNRLRFDFTHFQPLSEEEKREIERQVNEQILEDRPVTTVVMDLEEARRSGAVALFDEKYDERVRVVSVEGFSRELCGGTHLQSTAEASYFRILGEGGIASGVRRIEAVTGQGAMDLADRERRIVQRLATLLKSDGEEMIERLTKLMMEHREVRHKLEELARERLKISTERLMAGSEKIGDVRAVMAVVEVEDAKQLREAGDRIRDRLTSGVVVLAAVSGQKVLWLAMASPEAVAAGVHAGELVKVAAEATGGRGGGRADMAQAGGIAGHDLMETLPKVRARLVEQLGVKS